MKSEYFEIERLLAAEGVISRRHHPDLDSALRSLRLRGQLHAVLPGVYAPTSRADQLPIRLAALKAWDPDAVVMGGAAAALTFWPGLRVDTIECAVPHRRSPQPGFSFFRRRIPPELVFSGRGMPVTSPALTAIDLCVDLGGDPIDRALRSRMTTLAHLRQALELTGGRSGNRRRRQLLLDSRDAPWSEAEREAHRQLRAVGITGWKTNHPVRLRGQLFYLDIGFAKILLVIEIDGREHHIGEEVFEADRWRQNLLVLEGWLVLRFTWKMLRERPDEVLAMIREALAMRVAD